MALQKKMAFVHPVQDREVQPYEIIDNILITLKGQPGEKPKVELLLRGYQSKETRDKEGTGHLSEEKIDFKLGEFQELRPNLDPFLAKCYELITRERTIEYEEEIEVVNENGETEVKTIKKTKTIKYRDPNEYDNA